MINILARHAKDDMIARPPINTSYKILHPTFAHVKTRLLHGEDELREMFVEDLGRHARDQSHLSCLVSRVDLLEDLDKFLGLASENDRKHRCYRPLQLLIKRGQPPREPCAA